MNLLIHLMNKINSLTLFLIFLLISLGQLQRIEVGNGINFYLHDLVIWVWIFFNLVAKRTLVLEKLNSIWKKHARSGTFLLALICLGWLNAFAHGQSLIIPVLYTARLLIYLMFAGLVAQQFAKANVRMLLIGTGLLILLFGLIQYFFIPDTRFLAVYGWDDHYYRLISTLFDPAFCGLILVMTWCLLVTIRLPVNLSKLNNWPSKVIIHGSLITALLLTYSRSSYLAFAGGWCYLVLTKAKLRPLLWFAACVAIVGFIFLPKPTGEGGIITRTSTIKARQENAQTNLASLRPLDLMIGQGLFVSPNPLTYQIPLTMSNHARIPDNSVIFLVQSLGIAGAGLVFFWFSQLWRWSYRVDPGLAASLLALVIHSQFNASLVQPFVFLFILLAVASVAKPTKV